MRSAWAARLECCGSTVAPCGSRRAKLVGIWVVPVRLDSPVWLTSGLRLGLKRFRDVGLPQGWQRSQVEIRDRLRQREMSRKEQINLQRRRQGRGREARGRVSEEGVQDRRRKGAWPSSALR